jgi:hypothetical protein
MGEGHRFLSPLRHHVMSRDILGGILLIDVPHSAFGVRRLWISDLWDHVFENGEQRYFCRGNNRDRCRGVLSPNQGSRQSSPIFGRW